MGIEKKVAIVLRDEAVTDLLSTFAERCGYATSTMVVNERTSPDKIIQFLNATRPDLLILTANYRSIEDIAGYIDIAPDVEAAANIATDVKKGEGLTALQEVRKQYKTMPILMVTSDSVLGETAMRVGANGYLSAPITLEKLRQAVDTYIK